MTSCLGRKFRITETTRTLNGSGLVPWKTVSAWPTIPGLTSESGMMAGGGPDGTTARSRTPFAADAAAGRESANNPKKQAQPGAFHETLRVEGRSGRVNAMPVFSGKTGRSDEPRRPAKSTVWPRLDTRRLLPTIIAAMKSLLSLACPLLLAALGLAAGCGPQEAFCPNVGVDGGPVCPIFGDDAMAPITNDGHGQQPLWVRRVPRR